MSRRGDGSLFVGRLSRHTRTRDLEGIFETYGRLSRCEIKYGAEMAYAFVDYEDRRDAEDAIKYENGRDVCGSAIIVEWAKGQPRRSSAPRGSGGRWRDDDRYGYRRPRGRYRSPSPRRDRRRRSRSRSRDRSRDRSRSRSRSPRRSVSKEASRSKSRSRSISKSRSRSRSKS